MILVATIEGLPVLEIVVKAEQDSYFRLLE